MRSKDQQTDPAQQPKLIRRAFFKAAGVFLSGALAACGTEREEAWQAGDYRRTPTPASLQPVPPQVTPALEGLGAFLALSTILTGFENLDPALGQIYLHSLRENPEFSPGLNDLFEQAGFTAEAAPESLEQLEQAGIFDQEAMRSLADKIISLWYTGIYERGEQQAVATFVDSLAWKSLTFTKPPTICGAFGFWAERPKGQY